MMGIAENIIEGHKAGFTKLISLKAIEKVIYGDNLQGWCLACGKKHDPVEPDAKKYECSRCGEKAVHGAQEILEMGYTK